MQATENLEDGKSELEPGLANPENLDLQKTEYSSINLANIQLMLYESTIEEPKITDQL